MAVYRIADLNVEIKNRYDYTTKLCAAYLAEAGATPDLTIEVGEEEIDRAMEEGAARFTRGYYESICIYRHLCTAILHDGAFLVHSAVVEVDGRGYAFSAPSGTGKSTHIKLWAKYFPGRVDIINGDKPILRRHGDGFTVYGTPWCGKEGWQRNVSAPLAAICFLERSEENHIRRLSATEAIDRIFHQMLRPRDRREMELTLSLSDALLRNVPIYLLGCNISREAAELSFRTLTGQEV